MKCWWSHFECFSDMSTIGVSIIFFNHPTTHFWIIRTVIGDWSRQEKKNLINVSKFQIVHLQTEWKHTGHEENYSHFPEWLVEQFLHENGSSILFLKMTWSSKNWPSCLDKQLKWKDLKHLKHLIHCLLSILSFTITLCLFITLNW